MTQPVIRPMLSSDVDAAADMLLRGGWGDRRAFCVFMAGYEHADPFVAEIDGDIVATGVATVNGTVGWVGQIFVSPERRGSGIGTAMTQRVVDALESRGCRSLVLVATAAGRPIYERSGFEVQTTYEFLTAPGAEGPAVDGRVRTYRAEDLEAVITLDRTATGEDRSGLLAAFADPRTSVVAAGPDDTIAGFAIRAPWGGWATVAPAIDDGVRLLEWRRRRSTSDRQVVAGLPAANVEGRARLLDAGWAAGHSPVRMIRGEPPAWQPTAIWGQFGMAVG